MKPVEIYKISNVLLKETKKYLNKIAQMPKLETEEAQQAIFDSWERHLDTRKSKIIKTVYTKASVFSSGSLVAPVCLVESTQAKPEKNYVDYVPAFVFRFGNFPEQPFDNPASQLAYVRQVLQAETGYSDEDMYLEVISEDDIDIKISNSSYGGGVAVFFNYEP